MLIQNITNIYEMLAVCGLYNNIADVTRRLILMSNTERELGFSLKCLKKVLMSGHCKYAIH